MKKVFLIGATGSIGTQTLEVLKTLEGYKLFAVSAHTNRKKLENIMSEWNPQISILTGVNGENSRISYGCHYLEKVIDDVDVIVIASSGLTAARALLKALKQFRKVLISNKEIIVSFGELLTPEMKKNLIPIDSEHSAIFQLLQSTKREDVEKIVLTASGGPFLNKPLRELRNVKPAEALAHPTWKMGKKITVDSSTLMNKGLEVIEAHYLFDFPGSKIDVVIHPQSIVHGMIYLKDGNFISHMGPPDMKIPIRYALSYPNRSNIKIKELWNKEVNLNFYPPDFRRYPCLKLSYEVLKYKNGYPICLNAANEVVVNSFLRAEISFVQIPDLIEAVLDEFKGANVEDIDQVFKIDRWARKKTEELIKNGHN